MCIPLYMKLNWCSGNTWICGVVVLHRSMVTWSGALVYVHATICETYLV